jgi:hypothetical protein
MLLKNKDKENQAPEGDSIDLPARFKRIASLNDLFFLESSILLHIIQTPTCNVMSSKDFSVLWDKMRFFALRFHSPDHWKDAIY